MSSSDDRDEVIPQLVTNFHFEDEDNAPISFSVLPMWLVGKEIPNWPGKRVFLRGTGDGNQPVYLEVVAYKLGLEDAIPDILVLTKSRNKWIKLLRPRKVYGITFRSILITIHLLHYLRKNPGSSEKSLWDHMWKVFSSFEPFPLVNDLLIHYPLIKLLVESDKELAKCRLLLSLLEDKPRMKTFLEDQKNDLGSKKRLIIDDQGDDLGNDIGDDSDNEINLLDPVCAICDNGGKILCCEGRCLRAFHPTKEDGEESSCKSLGYSKTQIETIQNFVCRNCVYKRHQCYICGEIGSSDKSDGAEVFSCANATCGHFYHPKCVSKRLFPNDPNQAAHCENKIARGESFTCPTHKCHVCKQGENNEIKDLQFAVCRRCPRSYHRKCLPRKIAFKDDEEFTTRAWDDLLPSRILIYCMKHEIDEDLETPIRNHIVFPTMEMENKSEVPIQKTKPISSFSDSKEKKTPAVKCSESSIAKQAFNFKKQRMPTYLKTDSKSDTFDTLESKKFTKGKLMDDAASESSGEVIISSYPKVDSEGVKRINDLMESTNSSITLADVIKKRKVPSTHRSSSRNLDKAITWGKLEGSVEAVKTAVKILEDGGSVEDAKAICEPNVISMIMSWHTKLQTYLAPFIHGMHYTSFGRHFTKVDELSKIVDKLQPYVRNGDMIVDFCCGANDFSRLMKEKLDSVGKECSYKNYDIIQPKFDFDFEKRDWMSVCPEELPSGSRLIMGLSPPFCMRGALANQFIDKALSFKPKLIILIVPSETERLDKKRSPYDLIWEDSEHLAGKSFYLPGSVDLNDMQIDQWNNKPPPLYLWSRPDWTTEHKAIATNQGHIHDSKGSLKLTNQVKPQQKITGEDLEYHASKKFKADEAAAATTHDNAPNIAAESSFRSKKRGRSPDRERKKPTKRSRIWQENHSRGSRGIEMQKSRRKRFRSSWKKHQRNTKEGKDSGTCITLEGSFATPAATESSSRNTLDAPLLEQSLLGRHSIGGDDARIASITDKNAPRLDEMNLPGSRVLGSYPGPYTIRPGVGGAWLLPTPYGFTPAPGVPGVEIADPSSYYVPSPGHVFRRRKSDIEMQKSRRKRFRSSWKKHQRNTKEGNDSGMCIPPEGRFATPAAIEPSSTFCNRNTLDAPSVEQGLHGRHFIDLTEPTPSGFASAPGVVPDAEIADPSSYYVPSPGHVFPRRKSGGWFG